MANQVSGLWRKDDTVVMRAAAALLIANSHLEHFYPRTWLAGDGLTGNAFFFFLSGFGIALAGSSRQRGFMPWYLRRISRIYPSVLVAAVLLDIGLLQHWRIFGWRQYLQALVWPTPYGFVGTIMLVYIGLYWMLKIPGRWANALVLAILAAGYVYGFARFLQTPPSDNQLAFFWNDRFHSFFFVGMAFFGAWAARSFHRNGETFVRDAFLLVVIFAAYIAVKFAMVHGHFSRWFVILHLFTIAICILTLRVSAADQLKSLLQKVRWIWPALSVLAAVTLEIYIVQFYTGMPRIAEIGWPLNVVVFWVLTILGAIALAKAAGFIRKIFTPRNRMTPQLGAPGGGL